MNFKEITQKCLDFAESDFATQFLPESIKNLKDVESAKEEAKNLIDEIVETLPGGDNFKKMHIHEILEFLKEKQTEIKNYHEVMKP